MTQRLEVHLRGPLLLGGGGQRANVLLCLRDEPGGAPYIPASALKGALREQLARLCGPDEARRILGCEGRAAGRLDGGTTRVYVGDAHLSDDLAQQARQGHGFLVRAHVSLDRLTGRAADERLFAREVYDPAGPAVFTAEIDSSLLDDDERRRFEAALQAVYAIGAGRSVGLGAVELRLVTLDPGSAQAPKIEVPQARDVVVWLVAEEPLCLGFSRNGASNFRPTLDTIPAATLRGALVTAALARQGKGGVDQSADPKFRRLLLEPDACLRFSDALPVDEASRRLPWRAPFSLRWCKDRHAAHGTLDTLAQSWLVRDLAQRGTFVSPGEDCCFDNCHERLVAASGWLGGPPVTKRVITRVGLDAVTGRGEDGQLFSLEAVAPGTRFAARVQNLDDAGRELIAHAAARGLRMGRGRGQGYGRVRVVAVTPFEDAAPLETRVRNLDAALRALAVEADAGSSGGTLVVATLQTDLCPASSDAPADKAFAAALGLAGAQMLAASVRSGQRGGYDTKAAASDTRDTPKPLAGVVAAGSALLLRLPGEADLELLERHERRGIGARREEGYGSVRYSDPLHLPGWRRP